MAAPETPDELHQQLLRFPSHPDAANEFYPVVRPVLARLAGSTASFLAADLREGDVVQQAMYLIASRTGGTYDPARRKPYAFLKLIVRRATREVAAMYAKAGCRTRPVKGHTLASEQVTEEFAEAALEEVGEDARDEGLKEDTEEALEELRRSRYQRPPLEAAEQLCEVSAVLKAAPRLVAYALRRRYLEDAPVGVVAKDLGMNRFSLKRAIDRFLTAYAV